MNYKVKNIYDNEYMLMSQSAWKFLELYQLIFGKDFLKENNTYDLF